MNGAQLVFKLLQYLSHAFFPLIISGMQAVEFLLDIFKLIIRQLHRFGGLELRVK